MVDFTVLDHTADVGILAQGNNLRAAYEAAAAGLFHIIGKTDNVKPNKNFTVILEGDSLDELLVAWLNHLLFLHEVEKILLCQFKITELTENKLQATVSGEIIDLNKHKIKTYVKAATYHNLVVSPGDPAKVQVIFDV